MVAGIDIASVAALVGDPGRANMLSALMDGRALTATELALEAGVTAATASGHLGKLTRAQLITPTAQGRHRYFRLASQEVARLLESIMVLAAEPTAPQRRRPAHIEPQLRYARTCYDHLAGWLGVELTNTLRARGSIVLDDESGAVTDAGRAFLADFGIAPESSLRTRRMYCRPCLDWSERRVHVAGALGAALLDGLLHRKWIRRATVGRAVEITPAGRRGLRGQFGLAL